MTTSHFGLRFLLITAVTLLLALAGYTVFRLYPGLTTHAAETGLFLLAVAAGVASLFSPCSFPLLLTVLARRRVEGENGRFIPLLYFASAFAVGTTLFLLLTATAISLGAAPLISRITFTSIAGRVLRFVVGTVLIGIGLWQTRGHSLNMGWLNTFLQPLWNAQFRLRHRRSMVSAGLYGFGYILAGFG